MSTHPTPTGFAPLDAAAHTEFWVIRHAESEWNAAGRYQGQTDVHLSQTGREQAARLAGRLTGMDFDAVYSSDLARAYDTAQAVSRTLAGSPEVQVDAGLREIDVGLLAGKVRREIETEFPEYVASLRSDPWYARRPEGESMADLASRAARTFEELRARHAGQRILVVTHGGVVRVAVSLAIGGHEKDVWARLSVANTSITRVALSEGGGTLMCFNDTAHLERIGKPDSRDDLLGESRRWVR
ncbi:histidine phosphatase family protein [Deinococcus pimensis]|uniref:histidine phosphatase family protein n=1 Tax=Deinococcus pimensis TaxID=309888 RepID=UPI0004853993|nr:histidine phosphatase family protein [Deinococcus pimensis]